MGGLGKRLRPRRATPQVAKVADKTVEHQGTGGRDARAVDPTIGYPR